MYIINKDDLELIGAGGNNTVYRCTKGYKGCPAVVRIPKRKISLADETIYKWNILKVAHLPTLTFMEKCFVDGRECLICEDISVGNRVFISPQSVVTEKERELHRMCGIIGLSFMETPIDNYCCPINEKTQIAPSRIYVHEA